MIHPQLALIPHGTKTRPAPGHILSFLLFTPEARLPYWDGVFWRFCDVAVPWLEFLGLLLFNTQ